MEIKKANMESLDILLEIIKLAVADMHEQGVYQWDHTYPSKDIISDDIREENLYMYVDENIIKGFIVLNEYQDKEYEKVQWKCTQGKQLIVHRLCVGPKYKGKGIATRLIEYADIYGRDNNYSSIRLDTFIDNKRARRLYEKEGYNMVGELNFRLGTFCCFEKLIERVTTYI
ncbi:GNAT family N-acetyltransferase [Clostridium pasteurianum]|uniref:GNAT family N-acetyltransferase n=1 Tax=Clostridium pasteurianum TaxID=1501 RepID=UPI002260FB1B|nr:GNAT family N-acetyltransferase [Clostridium pasteurianum]UZW12479.1 GNAT family N-acetyltransferase [Clostridium pasteurianum]